MRSWARTPWGWAGWLGLGSFGCAPFDRPAPDPGPIVSLGDPAITDLELVCDEDAASWSFTVWTQNWAGGAVLWLARDAATAEEHVLDSKEASDDGTEDRLAIGLDITGDWREQVRSESTRFLCADEPELTFLTAVIDLSGQHFTDCRAWGLDPTLFQGQVPGAPGCDEVWSPPED